MDEVEPPAQPPPLAPWEVLHQRTVYDGAPWVKVCLQRVRLPDGRAVDDFHQVQMVDYVIIVAQTVEGGFIFERQYKHGVGKVSLTLPAGGILAGEEPLRAAQRELLEETGYEADSWQCFGCFACNANYGCGHAHIFIARNARRVAEPHSDDLEEMEIVFLEAKELRRALCDGSIVALASVAAVGLAVIDGNLR